VAPHDGLPDVSNPVEKGLAELVDALLVRSTGGLRQERKEADVRLRERIPLQRELVSFDQVVQGEMIQQPPVCAQQIKRGDGHDDREEGRDRGDEQELRSDPDPNHRSVPQEAPAIARSISP
jgi:hypothetical protein